MRRGYAVILFLLLVASPVFLMAISPSHTMRIITCDFVKSTGAAVTLLEASADTFAPSLQGINLQDYEYIGCSINLDDAADDAIDVDVTIQTSADGTNFVEYTQTCMYPSDEAGTATLNIDDEDYHHFSIHIAPFPYMRIVLDNNNADADVTPVVILNLQ